MARDGLIALRRYSRDQELEAIQSERRKAADSEQRLRDEASAISDERRRLNQNLIDTAVEKFGRVDIMVNNAGVETRTSILDTTEEQYEMVLGINLRSAFFGTQFAARQYTKWLSGVTTQFFRLPSEAEWEYACRAGTTTQYSFGDDYKALPKYGWPIENAVIQSHPVGTQLPNSFGLFDMHGNLLEWCSDWYDQWMDFYRCFK